ncbi:hypothetical protein [Streptomyces sp. NPDC048825]|uniref:hypothetical protein n=1 Tax=Streptomyces sp. NPDC048825 TaxID=3365592 RepID=UPI00371CF6AF
MFLEDGDRFEEGRALNNLAGALQQARRHKEAIDAATQAAAIALELRTKIALPQS